jgi:hypothetical protein
MPNLAEAALEFDIWMKNEEMMLAHITDGHYENNNKALLDFLKTPQGRQFVNSHDELVELAELIINSEDYGYSVTNPPCEKSEFAEILRQAALQEKEEDIRARQSGLYSGGFFQPSASSSSANDAQVKLTLEEIAGLGGNETGGLQPSNDDLDLLLNMPDEDIIRFAEETLTMTGGLPNAADTQNPEPSEGGASSSGPKPS